MEFFGVVLFLFFVIFFCGVVGLSKVLFFVFGGGELGFLLFFFYFFTYFGFCFSFLA